MAGICFFSKVGNINVQKTCSSLGVSVLSTTGRMFFPTPQDVGISYSKIARCFCSRRKMTFDFCNKTMGILLLQKAIVILPLKDYLKIGWKKRVDLSLANAIHRE